MASATSFHKNVPCTTYSPTAFDCFISAKVQMNLSAEPNGSASTVRTATVSGAGVADRTVLNRILHCHWFFGPLRADSTVFAVSECLKVH